jgi:pimeloyl-ACP methyl ester carboxylesterase
MPFYERGPVRIHYEEVGSGFPLLLIPGGGLNSALSSWQTASPFDPMERTISAVSAPISGTPTPAAPVGRWRSTAPGTPTPTTSSG